MKYRDLQIQTQREAPNNARTEGFSFLVRAGYLTRENLPTKLGEYTLQYLHDRTSEALAHLSTIGNENEIFFPIASGNIEVAHCSNCKYTERLEYAKFAKQMEADQEAFLPVEKIRTPECNSIEALANYLNIPKERTAKALMYTRPGDGKFIFAVVRGDMQLSEAKLASLVGAVRAATVDEITNAGAVAGYASAIGLKDALVVVDDLIPLSVNLVAGANEAGYHLKNVNYGRDFSAEVVADLKQAKEGDACSNCGNPLAVFSSTNLAARNDYLFENILLALAESYHNEKGLTFPHPVAPFDVYLMPVPGREIDTRVKAEEIYNALRSAGISVLFDDRDERAGVKFNDADLIGCPIRVTVGEKGLKDGIVEFKSRTDPNIRLTPVTDIIQAIRSHFISNQNS